MSKNKDDDVNNNNIYLNINENEKYGDSQEKLAELLMIKENTLSKYESNVHIRFPLFDIIIDRLRNSIEPTLVANIRHGIDKPQFYEDVDIECHLVGEVEYHLLKDDKSYDGLRSHKEALIAAFDLMQPLVFDIDKAQTTALYGNYSLLNVISYLTIRLK
ncbi:hypothetical protein PIROE2DRAFT_64984 [Piromyces sp. E2]|nr:hypothetical protein PIROE2DRAFT_64984 [Piromyces sp. E2]|eukprot:OUM57480.1 hypothetical protein PIROE2DRAFT_64984 [Piromyces sp. E2]